MCAQVQDLESTKVGASIDRALCYGPEDFRLGSFVNVYGRNLYLHDCDEFTRTWYKVRPAGLLHAESGGPQGSQGHSARMIASHKVVAWPFASSKA